jgi:hypothetical protein
MERKKQRLRVSFGPPGEPCDNMGFTEDVSPYGMFISSRKNQELGQQLILEVYLDEGNILLDGVVVWRRSVSRELRSVAGTGFGVRITSAPGEWYQLFL